MIIRDLKKEDVGQLAKLQYIKEQYIDEIMEIEKKREKERVRDITNYLEKSILNDVKIIIAIENDEIIGAIRISFLDDTYMSILFLIDSNNSKANNVLLKEVQKIKEEKNIKEILCISYYGLRVNKILEENGFKCESKTFRCKLENDIYIEKNKYIKLILKSNVKDLPGFITKEDVKDKNKIILLYEKEDIKECIVAGMSLKDELQIFSKPRPENQNIEKQLITELQRIGIEKGIRKFCSLEFSRDKKREKMLFDLGFIPSMVYYYKY